MDWAQRVCDASLSHTHTHNTPEGCRFSRNADDTLPNYCCSTDGLPIEPLDHRYIKGSGSSVDVTVPFSFFCPFLFLFHHPPSKEIPFPTLLDSPHLHFSHLITTATF